MPAKWQQWYPHDIDAWQSSATIQALSHAGYRAYHNLIQRQYQSDDGMLPASDRDLAKLSRVGEEWKMVRKEVLACFKRLGDRLFSPRQYAEWSRANLVHKKRLDAAEATNKRRRAVTDTVTATVTGTVEQRSAAHNTVHRQDNTNTEEQEPQRAAEHAPPQAVDPETTNTLVERIICAHPKSRLRNLKPTEVRQRDQAAVLEAMMEEIKASGAGSAAVLAMMLERTEILAENVPRSEWRYFKDVSEFFRNHDYRLEPEDFAKGKSDGRNGRAGKGEQYIAPANERVSAGVAAARAAARRSADRASGRVNGEHDGGVSAPGAGDGGGSVPDGVRGPGEAPRNSAARDGPAVIPDPPEILSPSERSGRGT